MKTQMSYIARSLLLVPLLAGGLALAGCDEKGSAEKVGKQIDEKAEQLKKDAQRAIDEAKEKAAAAAESVKTGTVKALEEAERKTDDAAAAVRDAATDAGKKAEDLGKDASAAGEKAVEGAKDAVKQ